MSSQLYNYYHHTAITMTITSLVIIIIIWNVFSNVIWNDVTAYHLEYHLKYDHSRTEAVFANLRFCKSKNLKNSDAK